MGCVDLGKVVVEGARSCVWMVWPKGVLIKFVMPLGFVEPGKVVQALGCACMVWAKDFLTECQSSFVERLG